MAPGSSSYDAPSPMVPFLLVATMVGMAVLPWLMRYVAAVVQALQQMNGVVFLTPLLILLGISLQSTYHNWMNYPIPNSSVSQPPRYRGTLESSSTSTGDDVLGSHQGDGTGVGLFILLVFALVLIPWR